MDDLTRSFTRDMTGIYETAKRELGYNATYFLGMLADHGAIETARRLVSASRPSDGFTSLWERERLDLTVEALILRQGYEPLFDEDLRQQARNRLAEYGWREV